VLDRVSLDRAWVASSPPESRSRLRFSCLVYSGK
jgi:hypothetical protein